MLSKLVKLHLDANKYCLSKVLILANLHNNTTLKKVWKKKKSFEVFLKCTTLQPQSISCNFYIPFHSFFIFLIFRILTTCFLRGQDKSRQLSPCYPFGSALKEVWGDDVGQRGYGGGTVCASGRTETEAGSVKL